MNHYNAGNEHWARGRPSEALAAFLGARAAFDRAITQGDRRPKTLDYAARNLMYLCRILGQERLDESLGFGHQAETTFQTLVRDHPDEFEYAWQLSLAQEELGLQLGFAGRWREAVPWREAVRQTLQKMAARHGNLVSRMAQIQERIAAANSNLVEAYRALDPAKYTPAIRRLTAEAHEICEKLSLVQPLPWNLRIVRALALYSLAEFQAEDGLRPDLEGLFEAERLWKGLLAAGPDLPAGAGEPCDRPTTDRPRALGPRPARRCRPMGPRFAPDGPRRPGSALRDRPHLRPGGGTGGTIPNQAGCPAAPRAAPAIRGRCRGDAPPGARRRLPRRCASRASRCSTRSVRIPTSERPWPTWSSRPIRSRRPDWIATCRPNCLNAVVGANEAFPITEALSLVE